MALDHTNSTALVRQSNDAALMPPPPKRIKRPRNVIDEESYTDAISGIIARDFFPGLLETELQQDYLDALESGNGVWISHAHRKLTQVRTPRQRVERRGTSTRTALRASDTPIGCVDDTPKSVISNVSHSAQPTTTVKVETNMSLDKFQASYTSEDNESFYKILDKQNQKRAEKYAWMRTTNKLPSKMMLKQKEIQTKLLESRHSLEDDGGKKDRLAIQDVSEKPAKPDAWKSNANNQLMFGPDGVEDSIETVAQKAQRESRAEPKGVIYGNTRMPARKLNDEEQKVPPSPSMSAIKDAMAGRRRAADSESGFEGSETPRVCGYAFVDDQPEPEPEPYVPPLIDLGTGEGVKNPFVIREQSSREDLHHRIVEKNARAKHNSVKIGMTGKIEQTPVPRFPSSPRIGGGEFTPAAQRLWSRVGNAGGKTQQDSFSVQTPGTIKHKSRLRARWTPSSRN